MITIEEYADRIKSLPASGPAAIVDMIYDVEDGILAEMEARTKIEGMLDRFQV